MANTPMSSSVLFAQAMLAAVTLAYGSAFLGLWISYHRPAMRAAAFAWLGLGGYSMLTGAALLRPQYAPRFGEWTFEALDYAIAVVGAFTAMAMVGVAMAVVTPQRPRRFLGVLAVVFSVLLCITVALGWEHELVIRVVVLAALGSAFIYVAFAPESTGRRSIMAALALFLMRPFFSLVALQPGAVTQDAWYTALQIVATIAAGFFTTMALFNIEREHAVGERSTLEHSLAHAQRMDSLGRMAASVAHDFNNILATVLAASDALVQGDVDATERREAGEDIEGAVKRGHQLTRALVTFAKPQTSTTEFDPFVHLQELQSLVERLVGKSIAVKWEVTPEAASVRILGDGLQFDQMLLNLAANARDAMSEGGTLTVRGVTHAVNLQATGESALVGPCLDLRITDTGCGMTPETIDHIFEPFFSTKPRGRGTGLGLSTAFGFVRNANGRMQVSSEVGRGSTFTVLLPLREERA